MEEEHQELYQVIFDVVVGLLNAQDARRKERLPLIAHHGGVAVPGEEAELEKVLENHHHLCKKNPGEKNSRARAKICFSGILFSIRRVFSQGRMEGNLFPHYLKPNS